MAEYRAYFIGRSGYIISQSPITCADDAEAVQQARQLVGSYAVELWSGDRLVMRLDKPAAE